MYTIKHERCTLTDSVNACHIKLAFLRDAFTQELKERETFSLTEEGRRGLGLILEEIVDEMGTAVLEMMDIQDNRKNGGEGQ